MAYRHNFAQMQIEADDAKVSLERAEKYLSSGQVQDAHYNLIAAGDFAYRLLRLINRSVKKIEGKPEEPAHAQ